VLLPGHLSGGNLDGAANVNVITCSRLEKLADGTDGLRYHASIPLYARGKNLGVLNVASRDWRRLTPEDLRLLYTIGDMLSIAVKRARLFARSAEFGAAVERNRLAREIHDTLAQGLAGIALHLETADALLEAGSDPHKARLALRQTWHLTQANLDEARQSVLNLRAAPLEGQTLPGALADLASTSRTRVGLQVSFTAKAEAHTLPLRIENGLLRIAQEALANVVQHA